MDAPNTQKKLPQKVFIIAGEASGDQLGADLIQSLKSEFPELELRGIGGDAMLKSGLIDSLFPMEHLSVMGMAEILPRIPKFINLIAKTVQAIRVFDPDMIITIDAPDFSFRVQKKIRALKIRAKQFHYVAPTVWAWRAGRAAKVKEFLDGMICLFPFEPKYFESEGLKSTSVGHPMVRSGLMDGDGTRFRAAHNIAPTDMVLGLFCGSRSAEVKGLSDLLIDTAKEIRAKYPDLICAIPTLPKWQNYLEEKCADEGLKAIVVSDPAQKWDAFHAPDVAIAVSGTVALELALAGTPHVITYKMHYVTWAILRRIVKTKFAHLGNVLLDKPVYPEFIQDDAEVENIAPILLDLLESNDARKIQSDATQNILHLLEPNQNEKAADRATAFIKSFFE